MSFYSEQILPRLIHLCSSDRRIGKIRQELLQSTAGEVLEIGFGSGLNIPFYSKSVTRLKVVEPSATARKMAQKEIRNAAFSVEFVGLDGQKLDLPDGSVDQAVSTLTLCTIPDPALAVSETFRVLKPGGKFFVLEHGLAPDPSVIKWQNRLNGIQRRFVGGCNLNRNMQALLEATPFQIESMKKYYVPGAPRPMAYFYQSVLVKPS